MIDGTLGPTTCAVSDGELRYGGYDALLADHTELVARVAQLQHALRGQQTIIEQLLVFLAEQDARITTLDLAWRRQQTLIQETAHAPAAQPV